MNFLLMKSRASRYDHAAGTFTELPASHNCEGLEKIRGWCRKRADT
jgi:hypothetical protein